MGSSVAEAQVQKKCYKNQTAGWQGVVKLDHLGAQVGFSVAPHETVWLTDDEALLTARAPQKAEDNPFVEQNFMFQDDQGVQSEHPMAPLVLVEDGEEDSASERFVPGITPISSDLNLHSVAAGGRDADNALEAESDRPVGQPAGSVPAGSQPAAVPAAHARPVEASWTENEDRTVEPQRGALGGSNDPVGPAEGDTAKSGSETSPPAQAPINSSPGAAEETAGVTQAGEETGAADQPQGDAPQGEFAKHEEVGSPDAPGKAGEGR